MKSAPTTEAARLGAALLLSLLLHAPMLIGLQRLRAPSFTPPLRIEGLVMPASPREDIPLPDTPPPQPLPARQSTLATPAAAAPRSDPRTPAARGPASPAPRVRSLPEQPSASGVRAPLLTARGAEPAPAGRDDFVVAPPVSGDETAPLPFATAPGPGAPTDLRPATAPGPATATRAGPASAVPDDDARATALAAHGRGLSARVAALRRYPTQALARSWQGRVVLVLRFANGGRLQEIAVLETSGHAVLDEQALDMVKRADPEFQVPDILRRRPFTLTVPVEFRLSAP